MSEDVDLNPAHTHGRDTRTRDGRQSETFERLQTASKGKPFHDDLSK